MPMLNSESKPLAETLFCMCLFVIPALVLTANAGHTQDDDPKIAERLMILQLDALKAGDYQRFTQNGNQAFKAFMDAYTFDGFKMQRGARLANGYRLEHLGIIKRLGMREHLWKVLIVDYKYELLGSLSLSDGKVVGFDLH